jgi:hypothetical protein
MNKPRKKILRRNCFGSPLAEVLQQKIVAVRTVFKDFDRRRFGQAFYRMPRTTRKLQGA